jgi:hypothetical protein
MTPEEYGRWFRLTVAFILWSVACGLAGALAAGKARGAPLPFPRPATKPITFPPGTYEVEVGGCGPVRWGLDADGKLQHHMGLPGTWYFSHHRGAAKCCIMFHVTCDAWVFDRTYTIYRQPDGTWVGGHESTKTTIRLKPLR